MTRLPLVIVAAALAAACSEPLKVETLQLGRSLNEDKSIAEPTTTFKPNETVYVSALNPARGEGTVRVRWYYGSQLLSDREKHVSFQRPRGDRVQPAERRQLPARRLQRRGRSGRPDGGQAQLHHLEVAPGPGGGIPGAAGSGVH